MLRRGFTLVELLLSLIVAVIVGGALVRMTLAQARFMDQQEAWRGARSVSRSGINRLVSDLRILETSAGLEAAAADGKDFTVRVPYAFGVMCSTTGALTTVSLLPVDSMMFNRPGFSGFAWRDTSGTSYNYQTTAVSLTVPGTSTACTTVTAPNLPITTLPSINGSPAGQVVNLAGAVPLVAAGGPPVGSIFFLFRRIRYEFKNSAALPGRVGLWQTVLATGATEELATPFDTTARVNFYVLNSGTAQSTAPTTAAERANVRGLELVLNGMSERAPGGSSAPKTANVTTSVFFENRPD